MNGKKNQNKKKGSKRKGSRGRYSHQELLVASERVKAGDTYEKAIEGTDLSIPTLFRFVTGKTNPEQVGKLSMEEQEYLIDWIIKRNEIGRSIRRAELRRH